MTESIVFWSSITFALGAGLGVTVMALCSAARRGDELSRFGSDWPEDLPLERGQQARGNAREQTPKNPTGQSSNCSVDELGSDCGVLTKEAGEHGPVEGLFPSAGYSIVQVAVWEPCANCGTIGVLRIGGLCVGCFEKRGGK